MPFRSEKQRRFLWAKHPDVAKRWAHKYPESNKNLPMYANKDQTEKDAALGALSAALVNKTVNKWDKSAFAEKLMVSPSIMKAANDGLVKVEMPKTNGPVYAGQETEAGKKPCPSQSPVPENDNKALDIKNPVAQKLAAVLGPVLRRNGGAQKLAFQAPHWAREMIAQQQGLGQAPQVPGVKRYAPAPQAQQLPMGAQPPAPATQPQAPQPSATSASPGAPDMAAQSPSMKPIDTFGGLSKDPNNWGTPNAAFGQKNAPDSLKFAGENSALYMPADDVLNAALKSFRASNPADFDGKPFDDVDIKHYFDEAVSHAGGRAVVPNPAIFGDIGTHKLNPAMPYVLDSVYRAGQAKGDTSWLTNPRLWTGVGIGAGGVLGAYGLKKLYDRYRRPKQQKKTAASSPAWQRSAGKNPEGGLNEKGRKSYERETGGNLKAPVTESNPSGERAKRQNSFCSRMCGMKRVNTGASTAKDPDSRINKSLRKWNCKCSSALEFGQKLAAEFNPARMMAQAEKDFLVPQRNFVQAGSIIAPPLASGAVGLLSGNPLYKGLTNIGTRGALQYMQSGLDKRISQLNKTLAK